MKNPMLSAEGTHEPRPRKARWVWHLVGRFGAWLCDLADDKQEKHYPASNFLSDEVARDLWIDLRRKEASLAMCSPRDPLTKEERALHDILTKRFTYQSAIVYCVESPANSRDEGRVGND